MPNLTFQTPLKTSLKMLLPVWLSGVVCLEYKQCLIWPTAQG